MLTKKREELSNYLFPTESLGVFSHNLVPRVAYHKKEGVKRSFLLQHYATPTLALRALSINYIANKAQ